MKNLIKKFNSPDTLGVISSYPSKNGEIARANAISRYTYLLTNSFPNTQKVIVFSEKTNSDNRPYLLTENILVVPSYTLDSPFSFSDLYKNISNVFRIKDFLVQFEFSIYGGKKVIPAFLAALAVLKVTGKNTSLVLHQVVTDLNSLSGHLGLHRDSFKTNIFNSFLAIFYSFTGFMVKRVIVHDELLKNRLSKFVDASKIMVIPHAVGDFENKNLKAGSKLVARKSLGLGKKDKVVGVYGYRSWYKGTDWIINTIHELSVKYPNKNIKLLVAGGVSPTLKDTWSYKNFDRRIKRVIKNANGSVKVTGFIPESDVWKVFAASDVMVFPYRTKMSASGAFSLTLSYKKPFLVSSHFAEGFGKSIQKVAFDLNTLSFEQKLLAILENRELRDNIIDLGIKLAKDKSWANTASLYLSGVKSDRILIATDDDATEEPFALSEA